MPIKNGRYKDSKGNVRHFETNENMVVVDSGQKTLKQKLTELVATIQEAVSSKVDALFVKDITGDKAQLQTVDKTNLVNAINELKRTGGSGGATLNVFKRTGGTWGVFTATQATTTFDVAGFNGTEKCLDVYYKGLPLIPDKDFNVSQTGTVTLGFELAINESVDYCVSDVSFNYDDLANKPNLDLKADKTEVDTLTKERGYLQSVFALDCNNAIKNGMYYADNTTVNKPLNTSYGSLIVNARAYNRCSQIFIENLGNGKIYTRSYYSDKWSDWKELATTDMTTALDNKIGVLEQETKGQGFSNTGKKITGTDLNNLVIGGIYYGNTLANCPEDAVNNKWYHVQVFRYNDLYVNQIATGYGSSQHYKWTRWLKNGVWSEWEQIATTSKINNLTLQNGWVVVYNQNLRVVKSGNICTLIGFIRNEASTSATTTITTLPVEYRPKDVTTAMVRDLYGVAGVKQRIDIQNNGLVRILDGGTGDITIPINITYEIG